MRELATLLAWIMKKGRVGEADDELQDLLAAVVLVLRDISESVDKTVAAWEKRNYWLKADRFRMEWVWAHTEAERLSSLLITGDVNGAIRALLPLLPKISAIKIQRLGEKPTQWHGARQRLLEP